MSVPSYHDVSVQTASMSEPALIFNLPFRVVLQCTRVGGWELWARDERGAGPKKMMGAEYDKEKPLRIWVAGSLICDSFPDDNKEG